MADHRSYFLVVPRRLRAFTFMPVLLIVMSCSSSPTGPAAISVDYQDVAEPGFIDQTVLLEYPSDNDVVPRMEYSPLDVDGAAVARDGVIA